ncbi:MAG: hypothetical protein FWD80_05255 [Propionibacteriaceae bacterium]|nr:hypothetical protein [Propionibacteriaceae bacterium]
MVGFVITAIIGFVMLCVALFLDGVLDMFDVSLGSGIISGASLGGLLCGVGFGGLIGQSQGWPVIGSLTMGAACGLVIAGIAIALYRWMKRSETPDYAYSLDNVVGTRGMITAGAGVGQRGLVQVSYLGSPRTISFVCDTPLKTGQSVFVTDLLGPELLKVASTDPPVPPGLAPYMPHTSEGSSRS